MTIDTEQKDEQQQASQDEQAGFDSAFTSEAPKQAKPVEAAKEAPVVEAAAKPEAKTEAAPAAPSPLTAEEIASLRTTAQEMPALRGQLRDAHGRIGALNDLLKQTREQKKDEGKPATLTAVELKRIKAAYPELAEDLTADIGEALSILAPKISPDDVTAMVNQRVEQAESKIRSELAMQALLARHPDVEDLKKTEHFWQWVKAMPEAERNAFQGTATDATFVARKLDEYKAHRDAKPKEKSQERLEQAITPQGAARASKSTLSDEEAMRKAFEDQFN